MTKLEERQTSQVNGLTIDESDRKHVVDFWYWIAERQYKDLSASDNSQLRKKLEKCKSVYEVYYPIYEKEGRGTQPDFEELLAYVMLHIADDGEMKHDWLVWNYVRASLHRVIIRNDNKMFKDWVKRQFKTKKELRA